MQNSRGFKKTIKIFLAKLLAPLFVLYQKKFPKHFEKAIENAGGLDYSAMQSEFNSLHQIFFQNMLSKIQFDKYDLENIRQAAQDGQIVYMMRNWGQIEYNFFNSLFLKENLPLAAHANLIHMFWWMPIKSFLYKIIARLHNFYTKGSFPDLSETEALSTCLQKGESPFVFLNLPILLNSSKTSKEDLLLPILEYAKTLTADKKITLIPLDFLYDRRPGKANKSLIDILFGEKENPGSFRKLVLFFRNYRKHAVAKVGDSLEIHNFLQKHAELPLEEQSRILRNQLHQDFYKDIFTVTGPALRSRDSMIDLTLQDKKLRQNLLQLAPELKKPIDSLYLESQEILEEIVADPNYTYLDLWDLILRWVYKNIYDGLMIDEEGLSRIKGYAKHSPLILVPSHRSHMDYLLLTDLFYQQKLSMPLVAAGANLSFWPMGHLFRKSGAYFLRRNFGSDPLYPLLFKTYIKTLLKEGYFQEFFIEGTRSRTGKLEEPRTGMLSLYLDCYYENKEKDFYFIPVSINYEKVIEDKSHVRESKGAKKEKESFWDLLKVGRFLKHRYGHVYVNFGKAISIKDYLEQNSLKAQSSDSEKRSTVRNLADEISREIEKVSVITAPNLVAAALLAHNKRGQNLSELKEKISSYQKALRLHKTLLSSTLQQNPDQAIEQTLNQYLKQGHLQFHRDEKENFFILEANQRAYLDYYKNALLPPLAHLSIGAWIIVEAQETISKSQFKTQYALLQKCFSHEFIKIPLSAESLEDLKSLKLISLDDKNKINISQTKELKEFSQLISNFVESYQTSAQALDQFQFLKWDEKTLIQKILSYGNTLYLKGDLKYPESLSQFLIKNAIHTLRDEGLLLSHEKEMGKRGRKIYSSKNTNNELKKWMEIFSGKFYPAEKQDLTNLQSNS